MAVQTLRALLTRRPFRLVMSSGQAYEIRHPEMAFPTRTDLLVGIDADEDNVPARFNIRSLLHVVTVEPLNGAGAGPTETG